MWREYINVVSIDQVLDVLAEKQGKARIIAGATDLILEIERGMKKGIDALVDITRIPGLDEISLDEMGTIHLGPLVTHNQCVASKLIRENAFPLARAAWELGSPQIRNRGTVAGNLITASPANDTITPLMALGTVLTLRSKTGERTVTLEEFYTGVRKTVLQPDEMLVDIAFPALKKSQKGSYAKLALRRAQAISLVNLAIILTWNKDKVASSAITIGAVAPTIIHAREAESYLAGQELDDETIRIAAEKIRGAARPISDVRSSDIYRERMVEVIARRLLTSLHCHEEKDGFPKEPILLSIQDSHYDRMGFSESTLDEKSAIITNVNGKVMKGSGGVGKTLLRFLREDLELTGTKEGCAEGECGACTVYLDGQAVMSCMVPAGRAHGAEIVTIEGLGNNGALHPVQQAFIEEGAVQCGYCTPGFVMAAVRLLDEKPDPSLDQIRQAITGNLCRCTGYYKIVRAIEKASQR